MFLKKRYSHSTTKSYYRLCSLSACTSSKNPQREQVVLEERIGFSFKKICFLMSFSSRTFGFIVFEKQLSKVSIVHFNSTENSSAREVDFSRANTAETASLS